MSWPRHSPSYLLLLAACTADELTDYELHWQTLGELGVVVFRFVLCIIKKNKKIHVSCSHELSKAVVIQVTSPTGFVVVLWLLNKTNCKERKSRYM